VLLVDSDKAHNLARGHFLCVQVAAAAALCSEHHQALQYIELYSASITGCARLPSPAEMAVKSQVAAGAETGSGLRPEEAVLWSAYSRLGDADLAHGMARAPQVRPRRHTCLQFHVCFDIGTW
jgi:hypothetical protein